MTKVILRLLDQGVWVLGMIYGTGSAIGHIRAGEDFQAAVLITSVLMFTTRLVDRPSRAPAAPSGSDATGEG